MAADARDPLTDPTDEEMAAAIAAVYLLLRRRDLQANGGSLWMRAARAEAVADLPRPATWATVERPR